MNHTDAGIPEHMRNEKKKRGRSDRLVLKDANAGQRIKDTADKVGVIGSIIALLIGFLVWTRAVDLSGFLMGLVTSAAGIFASFGLMSLLYKYGDVVCISIEQAEIIQRLEAQQNENLIEESAEQLQPSEEHKSAEVDAEAGLNPAAQAVDEQTTDKEASGISHHAETEKRNPEQPPEAVSVDRALRVAHFAERSVAGVICPVCGKWQTTDADVCFHCSCRFIFDD